MAHAISFICNSKIHYFAMHYTSFGAEVMLTPPLQSSQLVPEPIQNDVPAASL